MAATQLAVDGVGGAIKLVAGLSAALNELTLGLVRQFPHKRKVYFFKDMDPTLEVPTATLSREGCQLQALDPKILQDTVALNAELSSDALMILCSEDDPMLGRLYNLTHLEALSESKKIFLVRVSHVHHRFVPFPKSYSRHLLRVHSLGGQLAMILHSSRVRWPIQFAESVALPQDVLNEIEKLKQQDLINPDVILQFEAQRPAESQPIFAPHALRLPDRAVIHWTDMDGWAVISLLAKRLNLTLPPAGQNTRFETTSLNRWRGVRTMDWLKSYGFSNEMIRGTIIIDHRSINLALTEHLIHIRQEILTIQNG